MTVKELLTRLSFGQFLLLSHQTIKVFLELELVLELLANLFDDDRVGSHDGGRRAGL